MRLKVPLPRWFIPSWQEAQSLSLWAYPQDFLSVLPTQWLISSRAREKVLCPLWSSLQGYPLPLPQYLLVTTVSQANIKGMMGGDDRKHKYQKPRISECHLGDWLPQQLPFSVNRNHNHTSIYFFLSNYYVQGPVLKTSHSSLNPDSNPKI